MDTFLKQRTTSLSVVFLIILYSASAIADYYLQNEVGGEKLVEEGHPDFKKRDYGLSSRADNKLETITESGLKSETVVQGLEFPTSMAFIGPDDILVLEKEKGTVRRIINGNLLPEPVLSLNVSTPLETCMCGVTVSKTDPHHTSVYIYFSEIQNTTTTGKNLLANRLYRYELIHDTLQNSTLLLELPATAGPHHTGGAALIGPDKNVYLPVGDLDNIRDDTYLVTKAQNIKDSKDPDGRGGILRITQDGHTVGNGILGHTHPLNKYYAYGIRNSFGIDFDPVTGYLWDTENGPAYGDEINLVQPGFNSGWSKVQGMWGPIKPSQGDFAPGNKLLNKKQLVKYDEGKYSAPEFIWNKTVGPTALKFLSSDKLGKEYKNDLFVGDFNNGNIYHFDLNNERTALVLTGKLSDKIADTTDEINESNLIFGKGFGGITDIEVGPYDGYLYVVSIVEGKIFRVLPVK